MLFRSCGCELLIVVTESELTFAVVSKSQKGSFWGEEERVVAKGHSNEWGEMRGKGEAKGQGKEGNS